MTESKTSRAGAGDPPRFDTVVHMFDHAARRHPDRVAMICGDERLTYAEYHRAVAGLAVRLMELGGGPGARVVVVKGNSLETSVAAHAIWACGGQTVLLNPLYAEPELGSLIADAAPAVVLCGDDLKAMLAPLARRAGAGAVLAFGEDGLSVDRWRAAEERPLPEPRPAPQDPASLIYTGGTTGLPKAALHTHATLMAMVRQHEATWPLGVAQHVLLNVAPQSHVWGLCMTLLSPVLGGNTIVNVPRFRPDLVLDELLRHRVTVFTGGPSTVYHALMGLPGIGDAELGQLRRCHGGGAPFAAETVRAWERLTGSTILEGYGMSEAAPLCNNPAGQAPKIGSVGFPVPETELEVVDVESGARPLAAGESGELRVRGPQVIPAYWRRPEESAEAIRDGWLYTGDIGFIDGDGRVTIVDRKKDLALVGGYNVYPREIDEVLFAHPAVQEAATVGLPDPYWGEVVQAHVVLLPGARVTAEELRAYCGERLAEYKVPSKLIIAEALPKTPAGKIDKRRLREQAAEA